MSRFIWGKTEMCCIEGCKNHATKWKGILVKSRDAIRAGFCANHYYTPCPKVFNIPDCYGVYNKELGELLKKHQR